jgi:hypothetical protein
MSPPLTEMVIKNNDLLAEMYESVHTCSPPHRGAVNNMLEYLWTSVSWQTWRGVALS